mgnify:CR=1 FL=1|jgi:RimJ/RimL family protein N-acetyltransferase
MDINVREAAIIDSEDIFTWRNDETTRQMSFTTDKVDWSGHKKWLESSLQNNSRVLYICEYSSSNGRIGIVRFDIDNDIAIISINLNPLERGKGLSSICINKSIDKFLESHSGITRIVAEIKQSNLFSQYAFIRAGFGFVEEVDEAMRYQLMVYERKSI